MVEKSDKILPKFSENLFWDIDNESLDYEKHFSYILARVLDYGTLSDWKEITRFYSFEQIKQTALRIRSLFPKSLNFIAFYTKTPITEFRCYIQRQSAPTLWNS